MADFSGEFEKMSGGKFKAGDFKAAAEYAKFLGGLDSMTNNMDKYNSVLSAQIHLEDTTVKLRKEDIKKEKIRLGIMKRLLPWQNKELKHLKELDKAQSKNLKKLKSHNSAMGNVMGGLKKGAGAAAGGIGKMVAKLGLIGGAIGLVKKLADEFLKFNKFVADINKEFGAGSGTDGFIKSLMGAKNLTAGLSIDMNMIADAGKALATNMGGFNRVGQNSVAVVSKMQKAFGLSADAAADLFSTMNVDLGMTSEQISQMSANMADFAIKNGQQASLVMRDLSSSSSLVAMSMGRSVESITKMAINARKMGTTLEAMEDNSKRFILDFEGSAESIGQINNMLGSNINPEMMALAANAGDFSKVQSVILDQVEKYQATGERNVFIEQKLEELGGARMSDLIRQAKIRKGGLAALSKEERQQESLNNIIKNGMGIWERIKNLFVGPLQKIIDRISVALNSEINPMMAQVEAYAKSIGDALDGAWDSSKGLSENFANTFELFYQKVKPTIIKIGSEIGNAILSGMWSGIKTGGSVAGSDMMDFISMRNNPVIRELKQLGNTLGITESAQGNVFNSPTLGMVGEEGRSEVVIPTERIRNGMPVSKSVASELSSIGVPGFATGRGSANVGARTAAAANVTSRRNENAVYGAAGDPNAIRSRTRDFEMSANRYRDDLRKQNKEIWNKEQEMLDAREAQTVSFGATLSGFGGGGNYSTGSSGSFAGNLADQMFSEGMDGLKNLGKGLWDSFSLNLKGDTSAWGGFWNKGKEMLQTVKTGYDTAKGGIDAYNKGGLSGLARFGIGNTEVGMEGRKRLSNFNANNAAKTESSVFNAQFKQSHGMSNKDVAGGYISDQGGIGGIMKGAAGAGLEAGVDTLMSGGSLKDAVVSGGAAFASQAVGVGATAGLLAIGVPAPIAKIAGSVIGKVVVGGVMKMMGIGTWKKKDKRKKAMKNLDKALASGSISGFSAPNTLLKSIMNPKGKIDEGSKAKTITEIQKRLSAKGLNLDNGSVEAIMWAMIGTGNKDVADQLPFDPFEVLQQVDAELAESKGSSEFNANNPSSQPTGRSATNISRPSGNSGGSSTSPNTGSRTSYSAGNGGTAGAGAADDPVVRELMALRRELAQQNGGDVYLDGKKVGHVIAEGMEESAYQ